MFESKSLHSSHGASSNLPINRNLIENPGVYTAFGQGCVQRGLCVKSGCGGGLGCLGKEKDRERKSDEFPNTEKMQDSAS